MSNTLALSSPVRTLISYLLTSIYLTCSSINFRSVFFTLSAFNPTLLLQCLALCILSIRFLFGRSSSFSCSSSFHILVFPISLFTFLFFQLFVHILALPIPHSSYFSVDILVLPIACSPYSTLHILVLPFLSSYLCLSIHHSSYSTLPIL